MNTEPESGFGLPEIIIVVVFLLFASFVGMRIYEGYLRTTGNTPRISTYTES